MTYYRSTIVDIGPEVAEMQAAGVLILFAEPLPDALAEVSVVHRPSQTLDGKRINVGDTVVDRRAGAHDHLGRRDRDEEPRRARPHRALHQPARARRPLPGSVQADGDLPAVEVGQVLEFRAGS